MATKTDSTTQQVERFGMVGVLNTAIDYIFFISITKLFSVPLDQVWMAKMVSGSVAMINSFYFNRKFVFKREGARDQVSQFLRFVATTLVGVFIIQTSLVQFFADSFPHFGNLGYSILSSIGVVGILPQVFTKAFVIKTVAFGLATAGSMTWNFMVYRAWAFKK